MKLNQLPKEQQQKVILIGVVALVVIFGLYQFVIAPWKKEGATARAAYDELKLKLDTATATIKSEPQIMADLARSHGQMARAHMEYIPASDNALSWVTRALYSTARSVGVDIESVAELEGGAAIGFLQKDQEKRAFMPYGVRLIAQCGYPQLVRLVEAIEKSNPYLSVRGIIVQSQTASLERHQVTIVVEWPSWKDPAKGAAFQASAGGDHG